VPFPSPPWQLRAEGWLSVFLLWRTRRPDRPAGVYVAAFLDYQEGGVLTYHELLVARLLTDRHALRARVGDIWVDSRQSLAGGRALWAIPKQLADLPLHGHSRGVRRRDGFDGVTRDGQRLASGTCRSWSAAALVRLPFSSALSQPREDGTTVVTRFAGTARPVPCRTAWRFDARGPLAFLFGRRPVLSVRLRSVRLRFG
jgi:Acetoacetate decarboxylase (ADC)